MGVPSGAPGSVTEPRVAAGRLVVRDEAAAAIGPAGRRQQAVDHERLRDERSPPNPPCPRSSGKLNLASAG